MPLPTITLKKRVPLRDLIKVFLVALFLTASYRLLPIPLSDTYRMVALAVVIAIFCAADATKFAKVSWPLLAIMGLSLILDLTFQRTGILHWIVWAQFSSGFLVAGAVFSLGTENLKRLIWVSIGMLVTQYAMITFSPAYFIAMADQIGIVDPFVSHGRELERIYYAYFNANAAAYVVFYMLLAFLAVDRFSPYSRSQRWFGSAIMLVLILLTGGRGAMLLCAMLALAMLFSSRSTRTVVVFMGITLGWLVALPLYSSLVELIFLREESNSVRMVALWQYVDLIGQSPAFGHGFEAVRSRVEIYGFRASHNFFIELIASMGLILGGALIAYFIKVLVLKPKDMHLKILGFFALLPSFFNNTLLVLWGFIPLVVPVILHLAGQAQSRRQIQPSPPVVPVQHHARIYAGGR